MKGSLKHILLLGDSITEQALDVDNGGWAARLQQHYNRRAVVHTRGFSGYNTRWLRCYLDEDEDARQKILPDVQLTLAVIFLGANDAVLDTVYQHVPIAEYKDNLKALAMATGAEKIVFVTPPPYSAEKYMRTTTYVSSNREDKRTELYAQAVREVAAELQSMVSRAVGHGGSCGSSSNNSVSVEGEQRVCCLDINTLFRERMPNESWIDAMSDGLHFGPAANKLMFELLSHRMAGAFPSSLDVETMPFLLPSHRDFVDTGGPKLTGRAPRRRGCNDNQQQQQQEEAVILPEAASRSRVASALTAAPSSISSASAAQAPIEQLFLRAQQPPHE